MCLRRLFPYVVRWAFVALSASGCGSGPPSSDVDADADTDADSDSDSDSDADTDTDTSGNPNVDPLAAVLDDFRAASDAPPTILFENGFAAAAAGRWQSHGRDAVSRARAFLATWGDLYRIVGPGLDLGVRRVLYRDEDVVTFFQTYERLPVWGAALTVALAGDRVIATAGQMLTAGVTVDVVPALGPHDAEALARELLDDVSSPLRGEVQLMVFDEGLSSPRVRHSPRLVYRVGVGEEEILIDAHDGIVLLQQPLKMEDFDIDLEDANGSNAKDSDCYWGTTLDVQAGNEAGLFDPWIGDPEAESFWDLARDAYLYYVLTFGRDSYDDDGEEIELYVHPSGTGASYSPSCDLFELSDVRRGGFDTVVHELTHAVISSTSNLHYSYESGALHESYADVMAAFADGDWLHGQNTPAGVVRDLQAPTRFEQPDDYAGFVRRPYSEDAGGVHLNSGIMNRAAVLLTDGAALEDRTLAGIGVTKAEHLYYLAMQALPPLATFPIAAVFHTAIAKAWVRSGKHGFTVQDACDIENAYAAVHVSWGDRTCDGVSDQHTLDRDGDGVVDTLDNCDDVPNPGQASSPYAADLHGDVCDDDDDDDGVQDDTDNCERPNPKQEDLDQNGVGDLCEDRDRDGVKDDGDNCAFDANAGQDDADGDGVGDACDPDPDADGVTGTSDNCPAAPNPRQTDADHDGTGDACDACPGEPDEVTAWTVGIPTLGIPPSPLQPDRDGDGVPETCDSTPWGSGVGVSVDGLPLLPGYGVALPDGIRHEIQLVGTDGLSLSLPVPACLDCPDWFDARDGVMLSLDGLTDLVGASIVDDSGRVIARSRRSSVPNPVSLPRLLSFHVEGGRRYQVRFVFLSGFTRTGDGRFALVARER